jgi:hypothetical protein
MKKMMMNTRDTIYYQLKIETRTDPQKASFPDPTYMNALNLEFTFQISKET